jgi:hypothetical protein
MVLAHNGRTELAASFGGLALVFLSLPCLLSVGEIGGVEKDTGKAALADEAMHAARKGARARARGQRVRRRRFAVQLATQLTAWIFLIFLPDICYSWTITKVPHEMGGVVSLNAAWDRLRCKPWRSRSGAQRSRCRRAG